MTEKQSNRWMINVVVFFVVVVLVGFSIAPIVESALESQRSPDAAQSPQALPSGQQRADLENTARGYELVLQREPENQTALRGLVDARIALGDIKGTVEPLETLAELNPGQPSYTILLAQTKQYLGDREGAAQAYRNLLEENPGDMNALKGLSDLLTQQERPEAAVNLLTDVIDSAPQVNQVKPGSVNVSAVQLLLGEVYAQQSRFEEAITTLDASIKGSPQDFRPVLAKAIVLQRQGKADEAEPLFSQAESLAPAQYKDQVKKIATANTASPSPSAPASPAGASDAEDPAESPAE